MLATSDVGVTRVTEITRLDRIGVPTYVAVRPLAAPGAICVTAGKGWSREEARVGAMMEAVEQAWAEPQRAVVPIESVRVADLLDGRDRSTALLDLCPRWGSVIDLDAPILAVRAIDVATGEVLLVPAELVFHPAPPFLGTSYFGTGTNGLASGATVAEATVHAIVETLERDAISFHNVRDQSVRVASTDLPAHVARLQEQMAEMRLQLCLRHLPGAYGLVCINAVIVDLDQPQLSVRGDGLHLDAEIALVRAVTEAAQCRLTIIHGGRDDLDHFVVRFANADDAERARQGQELLRRLERGDTVPWASMPAARLGGETMDEVLSALLALLASHGHRVLRVTLTPPDYPVAVVRVIVPGLECCLPETRRVGPRLRRYMKGGA